MSMSDAHDPAWPAEWASLYDQMDVDRSLHRAFYAGLVSPAVSSLLDLGCGTGSITMDMAAGLAPRGRVVGVDLSARMVDLARERAPQHEWYVGDICDPPVTGQFDLITCCFHTLQALLDEADLARCLANVARLMAPGGRFAFDIYRPNLAWLTALEPLPTIARQFTDASGRAMNVIEHGARYDPDRRVVSGSWGLQDALTGESVSVAPITQRLKQYFPEDVARLLSGAGLKSVAEFGGLDRSAAQTGSKLQVHICTHA